MRKKILIVFGTRPEAIKMAPLVLAFLKDGQLFETKVCVTAQHREMLDQVLLFFGIKPDYDLNLMKKDQNLFSLTADIVVAMKPILDEFAPDYIFVHGDTTTSTFSALAGFYNGTKICHIEAGLRTFNKLSPFPEEINRQLTGKLADLHFAPTETAKSNLLKERVLEDTILVTGNTVIDALILAQQKLIDYSDDELEKVKSIIARDKKVILVTGHRRENFGDGFLNICKALKQISADENVQIIYPVHLNPNVQKPVYEILKDLSNVLLIEPLSYPAFVYLMQASYIILTDSGGIQEEAPSLGKPVLVMRKTTERPEALIANTIALVGTDTAKIVDKVNELLYNSDVYNEMAISQNPYGDGTSATKIVDFLKTYKKV